MAWSRSGSRRADRAAAADRADHILVTRSGDLLLAWGAAIERCGPACQPFWEGADERRDRVTALAETPDGRVVIGTERGLVFLDAAGNDVGRELEGMLVLAIAALAHDRMWVGTYRDGLQYRGNGVWYGYGYAEGLPSESVGSLLVDSRGRLWISTWRLLTAPADEAGRRIKNVPPADKLDGEIFESLDLAVEKLLPEKPVAGGIAWSRTAERTVVFFDRRLVHPHPRSPRSPRGYRRADGRMAIVNDDWTTELFDGETTTVVPQPEFWKMFQIFNPPQEVFLDSQGRVWADAGPELAVLEDGAWRGEPLFTGRGARAFAEDLDGNIWVGTADKERSSRDHIGTVHRFNGRTWTEQQCDLGNVSNRGPLNHTHRLPDGRFLMQFGRAEDTVLLDPRAPDGCATRVRVGGPWDFLAQDDYRRWWSVRGSGYLYVTPPIDVALDRRKWGRYPIGLREGIFSQRLVASALDDERRIWLLDEDGRTAVYELDWLQPTPEKQ